MLGEFYHNKTKFYFYVKKKSSKQGEGGIRRL